MSKQNNKPALRPTETVLERPDLIIGTETGNIGLVKGDWCVYVRVVKATRPQHRVGGSIHLRMVRPLSFATYTGPIDDELMAAILEYGG